MSRHRSIRSVVLIPADLEPQSISRFYAQIVTDMVGRAVVLYEVAFAGRSNAAACRDRSRILRRKRPPRPKADQLLDVLLDALRRNLLQGS